MVSAICTDKDSDPEVNDNRGPARRIIVVEIRCHTTEGQGTKAQPICLCLELCIRGMQCKGILRDGRILRGERIRRFVLKHRGNAASRATLTDFESFAPQPPFTTNPLVLFSWRHLCHCSSGLYRLKSLNHDQVHVLSTERGDLFPLILLHVFRTSTSPSHS